MGSTAMTRRGFVTAIGAASGAALLDLPFAPRPAGASYSRGQSNDYIQLNSNENPYGPLPSARAALAGAAEIAGRYPDALEDEVRAAIAKLHGVAPEQVVLGCGSIDVLRMADGAFLDAGRTVVVAEPTFEAVLAYNRVTRAKAITVPLNAEFRHDLAKMAAACDASTGLVYVCNPNNPTGTIVTGDELAAFLGRVPPAVTVVLDEAYHHFVEHPGYRSGFDLLAAHPNLVVLRTFSKIYGLAGMRLGYAVGAKDRIEAIARHASFSNANAAVLAACLASLADAEGIALMRGRINAARSWLTDRLAAERRRFIPSEANFVMVETGRDVAALIAAFEARRILVGRRFPSMPTWLRVSIGRPEEVRAFAGALGQLVPVPAAA